MKIVLIYSLALSVLLLSACNTAKIPGVYRIDVQQGNDVSQEMINKVQIGMSKSQVTFILGTPLLIDTFHPDRWDYLYSFHPGNGKREQRHITLFFSDDTLDNITGDVRVVDYADLAESERQDSNVIVPLGKKKVGFFQRILNGVGLGDDDEFIATDELKEETIETLEQADEVSTEIEAAQDAIDN